MLNSPEHVDEAPATVYAKLLDEGRYLASERTMYRVLADHGEVKERRRQATHPPAKKPRVDGRRPESCLVVGYHQLGWCGEVVVVLLVRDHRHLLALRARWMLATAENHTNAKALLAETIRKQNIAAGQLYIHSDRGSPMIAKPVAFMLAELGVTKSHSRPHVSNDNPFSEAHSAR